MSKTAVSAQSPQQVLTLEHLGQICLYRSKITHLDHPPGMMTAHPDHVYTDDVSGTDAISQLTKEEEKNASLHLDRDPRGKRIGGFGL